MRPLCLGRIGDDWVAASETCALDLVGADFVREVDRGERSLIDGDGVKSLQAAPPDGDGALCIFEFFYLARPDTRLAGVEVHAARVRMGERLAAESPVDADLVLPIPDSGTPAAIGFSRATGIPFSEGLIKNRYVGRTFIQPEQGLREQGIRLKFNPLAEVAGQRVVVVDDSIVRGNTTRQIVRMLFDAGASEVHVRISSPPVIGPCFYGIDFADEDELVASSRSVEAVRPTSARRASTTSRSKGYGGDAAPGVGALPRLPHPGLSDPVPVERQSSASSRLVPVAQVADPLSRIRDRLAPKAAASRPLPHRLPEARLLLEHAARLRDAAAEEYAIVVHWKKLSHEALPSVSANQQTNIATIRVDQVDRELGVARNWQARHVGHVGLDLHRGQTRDRGGDSSPEGIASDHPFNSFRVAEPARDPPMGQVVGLAQADGALEPCAGRAPCSSSSWRGTPSENSLKEEPGEVRRRDE